MVNEWCFGAHPNGKLNGKSNTIGELPLVPLSYHWLPVVPYHWLPVVPFSYTGNSFTIRLPLKIFKGLSLGWPRITLAPVSFSHRDNLAWPVGGRSDPLAAKCTEYIYWPLSLGWPRMTLAPVSLSHCDNLARPIGGHLDPLAAKCTEYVYCPLSLGWPRVTFP